MLRELRIANVAIIDEVRLSFVEGFNVLTGETGAGKSIIMRAVGLLCGDRAGADLLRADAAEAAVEAVFDLDSEAASEAARLLLAAGVPAGEELLVRRVIGRGGKGRVYVNGGLATAALLTQLSARLLHVYGQHEQALLLDPSSHADYLDRFGRLGATRERMAQAYRDWREAATRLADVTAGGAAARQRLELLEYQANELRAAAVCAGEEARLLQERERRRHAEKLGRVCREGEAALYSGEPAIGDSLGRLAAQLRDAARIDPALGDAADLLAQATAQVEEAASQLRRAAERIDADPGRLEEIEERLSLLGRLKRKYGADADALPEALAQREAELGELQAAGFDAAGAQRLAAERADAAWAVALELSDARRDAARRLEKRMTGELAELGLAGAAFRVVFESPAAERRAAAAPGEAPGLTQAGADGLQFHFSANPGEAPRPLARIASGGELSRILLALKTLTAGAGEVPTMIFDEVDAGIGGTVAEAVGRRLHALARSRQILCITHLPQIAAQADHHFAVVKSVAKGRTTTAARALEREERVAEIARMLGNPAAPESQRYARRLVEAGDKRPRGSTP